MKGGKKKGTAAPHNLVFNERPYSRRCSGLPGAGGGPLDIEFVIFKEENTPRGGGDMEEIR